MTTWIASERLVGSLQGLLELMDFPDGGVEQRVQRAVDTAVEVFAADGAGVMFLDRAGTLRLVGATNPAAAALEYAQLQIEDGPGIQTTRRGAVVSVADLEHDPRWPRLWDALAEHEVHAVLSAPIWLYGRAAGNLNLLSHAVHDWSRGEGEALSAYAGVLTAFLRVALDAGHGGTMVQQLRDGGVNGGRGIAGDGIG